MHFEEADALIKFFSEIDIDHCPLYHLYTIYLFIIYIYKKGYKKYKLLNLFL